MTNTIPIPESDSDKYPKYTGFATEYGYVLGMIGEGIDRENRNGNLGFYFRLGGGERARTFAVMWFPEYREDYVSPTFEIAHADYCITTRTVAKEFEVDQANGRSVRCDHMTFNRGYSDFGRDLPDSLHTLITIEDALAYAKSILTGHPVYICRRSDNDPDVIELLHALGYSRVETNDDGYYFKVFDGSEELSEADWNTLVNGLRRSGVANQVTSD